MRQLDVSTTKESLLAYFSIFGKVSCVELMKQFKDMRKNTALITYAKKDHADVALSYAGIIKREKGFKIDLYLQGDSLNQRNMWMAKHRIHVGYVPKELSETEFRETFTQYGKITEAYIQ